MTGATGPRRFHRTTAVQFVVLLTFWFALSMKFEPLFVVLGVATAATVTAITHVAAGAALRPGLSQLPTRRLPLAAGRGVVFVGWMAGRIVVSSVQLARAALSPRLPIDPCTLWFRTELRSPLARTVLTNSISLVPGTLTVEIEDGWVLVHALAPEQAGDLLSGKLQNKVAGVFLDAPQPPALVEDLVRGPMR